MNRYGFVIRPIFEDRSESLTHYGVPGQRKGIRKQYVYKNRVPKGQQDAGYATSFKTKKVKKAKKSKKGSAKNRVHKAIKKAMRERKMNTFTTSLSKEAAKAYAEDNATYKRLMSQKKRDDVIRRGRIN